MPVIKTGCIVLGLVAGAALVFQSTRPGVEVERVRYADDNPAPLTDWQSAWERVREDKAKWSIRLIVYNVPEITGGVQVVFVDRGEETSIGWAAFYPSGVGKSNFAFSLTNIIASKPQPPTADAVVVVRNKTGTTIKTGAVKVELVCLTRE